MQINSNEVFVYYINSLFLLLKWIKKKKKFEINWLKINTFCSKKWKICQKSFWVIDKQCFCLFFFLPSKNVTIKSYESKNVKFFILQFLLVYIGKKKKKKKKKEKSATWFETFIVLS